MLTDCIVWYEEQTFYLLNKEARIYKNLNCNLSEKVEPVIYLIKFCIQSPCFEGGFFAA